MSKKIITIEFVKQSFANEGYILLSSEYISAHDKLKYICSEGHRHTISWANWQQGKRCAYCSKRPPINIENIKLSFESENHILLTKEYKNNSQKLEYICPKVHKHSISWTNWQKGARCPYCAGNAVMGIDYINDCFSKEGYKLLTKNYINCAQKLQFICPNGHKHYITWDKWRSGSRCYYCSKIVKKSIDDIKQSFEEEGYQLLTTYYLNNTQKLRYKCKNNHYGEITWRDWNTGRRCGKCYKEYNFGANAPNWKGGVSCDPYCDAWADKEYKKDIKERDGNQCLNPHCKRISDRLSIHHIDYNKQNCSPSNLITLCISCNSMANKDRKWHIEWYQTILNKRYNFNYKE
jgi:hypothetical protein